MTVNPHRDFYKGRVYFDRIYQEMRKSGVELSKADILRDVGLRFPVSIQTFEKYIEEFYIKPGLLVEDKGFYLVNTEHKEPQPLVKAADGFDAVMQELGVR